MNAKEKMALTLLSFGPEHYARDLVEASGGFLTRTGIYPLLAKLIRDGLATRHLEDRANLPEGFWPRSMYAITDAGRKAVG